MLDRVAGIISRYNMFARGQRVGVAVSGGADSVCLLHVLTELAPRLELTLKVLHLNHQLRADESDRDAEFVRELAESLGYPAIIESAEVGSVAGNLEQAGRRARSGFYKRLMTEGAVDLVATGHSQSDQAETVLYRILRGSGTAGVSGVRPVSSDGLVRPLLDCTREQVESYLKDRNIGWREDATNQDRIFVRNRIRHELLPQLVRDYNPLLPKALAQMAALAQDEEQYWGEEVDRAARKILTLKDGVVLLRRGDLLALPRALSRRLLRRAIQLAKGDLRSIDFEHVEGLLRLAKGGEGHGRLQLPDLDVFRSFDWMRIAPPRVGSREDHDYQMTLPVPGSVRIPEASSMIRLDLFEFSGECRVDTGETGYTEDGSSLDGAWITGPLELRNWRPGDQYTPAGRSGEKIKFLFQQERIPIWERQGWPVLTNGGRIVWARRFGVAAEFAVSAATRRVVRVIETADGELANVT